MSDMPCLAADLEKKLDMAVDIQKMTNQALVKRRRAHAELVISMSRRSDAIAIEALEKAPRAVTDLEIMLRENGVEIDALSAALVIARQREAANQTPE